MEKLILIDGNSLLNRGFYATPLLTDKEGNPAQTAIKVVYGSELAIKNWYGDGEDNYYLTAGTYNISIEIATGVITIVKA